MKYQPNLLFVQKSRAVPQHCLLVVDPHFKFRRLVFKSITVFFRASRALSPPSPHPVFFTVFISWPVGLSPSHAIPWKYLYRGIYYSFMLCHCLKSNNKWEHCRRKQIVKHQVWKLNGNYSISISESWAT